MTHWETVHTETRGFFDITLSITNEDLDPRDHFDECLIDEVIEGIENGHYIWFIARVQASNNGVILGESYLGGCLYSDIAEFIADEYWHGLIGEALDEAKRKIKLLALAID